MIERPPVSLERRLREVQRGLDAASRVLDQVRSEYAQMLATDATPVKSSVALRPALRVTPRQAQILELIAAGLPDKMIARRLGISRCTLRTHLDRFFRLNGVHDRAGAAATWVRSSALF